MKFLSFMLNDEQQLGLLIDTNEVVNLSALFNENSSHDFNSTPLNVSQLIELGDNAIEFIQQKLSQEIEEKYLLNTQGLEILAPLSPKKNIFCVGRNYRDHIIESNIARGVPAETFPQAIEFFTKPTTTVTCHNAAIPRYASITDSLDYEVELAIVIGKKGKKHPSRRCT